MLACFSGSKGGCARGNPATPAPNHPLPRDSIHTSRKWTSWLQRHPATAVCPPPRSRAVDRSPSLVQYDQNTPLTLKLLLSSASIVHHYKLELTLSGNDHYTSYPCWSRLRTIQQKLQAELSAAPSSNSSSTCLPSSCPLRHRRRTYRQWRPVLRDNGGERLPLRLSSEVQSDSDKVSQHFE